MRASRKGPADGCCAHLGVHLGSDIVLPGHVEGLAHVRKADENHVICTFDWPLQ
jgi:hypothetical protein